MENFIDGYSANEETMREGMLNVMGEKNTIFILTPFSRTTSQNPMQNISIAWVFLQFMF